MKSIRLLSMLLILLLAFGACAETAEEAQPAGYVLVTTATQSGWLALPTEEGDKVVTVSQTMPDGTQALNVVHLMPNGVYMEDANCANHDCMDEGEITLENIPERILGNMIICLPNQVILQLYTAEEALAIFGEMTDAGE